MKNILFDIRYYVILENGGFIRKHTVYAPGLCYA